MDHNLFESSIINTILTDEDVLASLANADFSRSFFEDEQENQKEKTTWTYNSAAQITEKGKAVVESDPNMEPETFRKLMMTESELISEDIKEYIASHTKKELTMQEFFTYKNVGQAHLSQCVKQNIGKTMADLICTYSEERRIPFIVGAIYIDAFKSCHPLFYYMYSSSYGFRQVGWKPENLYIAPISTMPPVHKAKDFKKYYDPGEAPKYTLPNCPICNSPATMLRAGIRNRLWHVCCTDPQKACEMFCGLEAVDSEKKAAQDWIDFCQNTEKGED